jgi:hypothetical protein
MGNSFLVAVQGDNIVMFNPPRGPISKEQALNLAAWLVALADTEDKFDRVLAAVQS